MGPEQAGDRRGVRRRAAAALALVLLPMLGAPAVALEIPVASREYKQGIDIAALGVQEISGAAALAGRLRGMLDRAGTGDGTAPVFEPGRRRMVRFLDTDDCRLWQAGLLLRLRGGEEGGAAAEKVTLKARSQDLFRIAGLSLEARGEGKGGGRSWQDDFYLSAVGDGGLVPVSDYALSVTWDGAAPTGLGALRERVANLSEVLPEAGEAPLRPGPAITEVALRSGPLRIAGRKTRLELSLWYRQADGRLLAGDLSFTLKLPLAPGEARQAGDALAGLRAALGRAAGGEAEKSIRALPEGCGKG
ncbi:MAG: hypothetical protein DI601_20030 [Azospirillum brasilense]|nr:MAG: hypothetical protein DI601_20030 [Azospirillum brasilense]